MATLVFSVMMLALCIFAYDSYSRFTPSLIPLLLATLGLAVLLNAYSVRNFRKEYRKTDKAFRDTDREFSSIFQNVLDGILILDNQALCLDANPAAASILRVARTELIGKDARAYFKDCVGFTNGWENFLQSTARRGRAEIVAGDGARIFVDFTGTSNYLPGRHIFILCDVTERRRAEKALRDSEERFQYMADNIQEIIWTMDAETKEVVYVNQAYVTITGHSIESLHENPSSYRELIHPQDRIRVLSKLQEVVGTGFFDEEFQFIHGDGSARWIWMKAHPVRENGHTRWLVGTAQDITSRKEAEKQIAEHLDVAEAARAEAEALRKATLALNQNLTMDSVLDTLLECIRDLVPFDKATILFVDDPAHLMVAREASRDQSDRAGFVLSALGNVFLQRILFEHSAVLLSDAEKESDWKNVPPFDRTRSWLGIPLTSAGTVIGILSVSAHEPSAFTTEHLRLAKSLAVSAAVAIQNARVHERAEIYAAELEVRLKELRATQSAF